MVVRSESRARRGCRRGQRLRDCGHLDGRTAHRAQFRAGGDGIDNGMGENAESLMISNDPDAMNGYTRGAWGWLDSDGD
ncbi:MAG: hypothetical protein WAU83_01950, partial [Pseudonocardiaceae bacterium]